MKFQFDNITSSVRDQLLLEKYIATKSGERNSFALPCTCFCL